VDRVEVRDPQPHGSGRRPWDVLIVWTTGEGKDLLTFVLNIGESGHVSVRNIDLRIAGSVELGQNDYTMIEKGKSPTAVSKADYLISRRLSRATEIKDQTVRDIPDVAQLPGFDVAREPVTLHVLTRAAKGAREKPAGATHQETGSSLGETPLVIRPSSSSRTFARRRRAGDDARDRNRNI
jgi:hypothetical protein